MEDPIPTFSDADALDMLVHSSKANLICARVRKVFNLCRATPFGRVVDPSLCLPHAQALIQCFHEVRKVPEVCFSQFSDVKKCLETHKWSEGWFSVEFCEGAMSRYAECEDPRTTQWANY